MIPVDGAAETGEGRSLRPVPPGKGAKSGRDLYLISGGTSAQNEVQDQGDDGENQQQVNESASYVKDRKTAKPSDQ